MADLAADIAKHASSVDQQAVAGILRTYRLVMSSADSARVSFGDPGEVERVKKNFCIKKLGLDEAQADAAIAEADAALKGVSPKYRTTVYYLIAAETGKLDVFH